MQTATENRYNSLLEVAPHKEWWYQAIKFAPKMPWILLCALCIEQEVKLSGPCNQNAAVVYHQPKGC